MFQKILMPVDLAHARKLEKAMRVAGDLARGHDAELCFVGVTAPTPSAIAKTPDEFAAKLAVFAKEVGGVLGVRTSSHALVSHDPSTEMDRELEKAVKELGADLVVMATHAPNVTDYIWSGHGAHLATHSEASVMLVRG